MLNPKEVLKEFKKEFDLALQEYFKQKKKDFKENLIAKEALEIIKKFTVSGGKRLRPALVYYGFKAFNRETELEKEVVKTSVCIELIHSFLLMHDDIIDQDEMRHGVDTVHKVYEKIAKKFFPKANPARFGVSMAIVAGDMTAALGNEVLFKSNFPAPRIILALKKLQEIVNVTIPGEMLDVMLEAKGMATEKEVLEMYRGKTACYTFEGPLHLGAILAGAAKKDLENFSNYAIPVGIAFQIRDDILGIFGDEKKLGKPVGSDIIEGKQTLLVIKALSLGNKEHKNTIKNLLGKNDLTPSEIELFRKSIADSGALNYAQNLSEKLVKDSLAALEKMNIKSIKSKEFFESIARYIIEREQ